MTNQISFTKIPKWHINVDIIVPFYVFNFFIIGYVRIALLPLHGHRRGVWREGWLTNGGTEAGTAEAPVGRRPNGGRPFYGPLPFKTGRARPPPPFRSHAQSGLASTPPAAPASVRSLTSPLCTELHSGGGLAEYYCFTARCCIFSIYSSCHIRRSSSFLASKARCCSSSGEIIRSKRISFCLV